MTPNSKHPGAAISERRLLVLISAVQFVNVLDFMVVMPLGPDFARDISVPLSHLGWIGGSYTASAAVAGLLSARFLDRFDRRTALAVTLLGLVVGTAAGGMATGLGSLMAARVLAGGFGGPATALSLSIIADMIPPERRGRALSVVMTAFTVATVAGLPAALELSRLGGWRSTFFALAAVGLIVAGCAIFMMPSLRLHLNHERPTEVSAAPWFRRLGEHKLTVLALLATFSAMTASFAMIPNISSYVQGNLHYPRADLGLLFLAGGLSSFVVMRVMGPVIDRVGAAFTAAIGTGVFVTLLGCVFVAELIIPTMLIYVAFMSSMALRNMSLGALSTRVPLAHERARFMSLQSAVQHSASALGSVISAQLLHERPDRSLEGMPKVGSFAIIMSLALPVLLYQVEKRVRAREAAAVAAAALAAQ